MASGTVVRKVREWRAGFVCGRVVNGERIIAAEGLLVASGRDLRKAHGWR